MFYLVYIGVYNVLCSNLIDNCGFSCGSSIVACAFHSRSRSVI